MNLPRYTPENLHVHFKKGNSLPTSSFLRGILVFPWSQNSFEFLNFTPPGRTNHDMNGGKKTPFYKSGHIIATPHDLTPNGGLVREFPLFQGNLGWWNIISFGQINRRYIFIIFTQMVGNFPAKDVPRSQPAPIGNPYISPIFMGSNPQESQGRTQFSYHGYTYVGGTPVLVPCPFRLPGFSTTPVTRQQAVASAATCHCTTAHSAGGTTTAKRNWGPSESLGRGENGGYTMILDDTLLYIYLMVLYKLEPKSLRWSNVPFK